MRRLLLSLIAILASAVSAQAQSAESQHDITLASWIGGCWELRAGSRVVHEQWMAPSGGAMLGMSRTVARDSLRDWEFVLLGPSANGLAYQVRPARQADASFPAVVVSDTLLVFENRVHDFPQRIIYRRRGADSLLARIEGEINGQARAADFPYARISCSQGR